MATQEDANREGKDASNVLAPNVERGDRVRIDELDDGLGIGTVVSLVFDVQGYGDDDVLALVELDEGRWCWAGTSGKPEGTQAVAFMRIIAVHASNLSIVN